jgi:hypothetical protein
MKNCEYDSRAQCYKTFYGRNLRVLVRGKLFQASVMSVCKAGTYPIEAPFRCSTIG